MVSKAPIKKESEWIIGVLMVLLLSFGGRVIVKRDAAMQLPLVCIKSCRSRESRFARSC